MPSKQQMAILRKRVKTYRSRTTIADVDPSKISIVVKAPVDAGMGRFVDVQNLPSPDDLPFVPERLRDFAFRYATEYRTIPKWAELYGVSVSSINKWVSHSGVSALVALTRYERRVYHMGRILQIETRMYEAIYTILDSKITTDNMGTVLSTAKFMYDVLNRPEEMKDRDGRTFNINVGFSPSGNGQSIGSRNSERDVTPVSMKALEDRVAYLKNMVAETEDDDDAD